MRVQVEDTVTLEAPGELVYAVLADADRYRDWLPGVSATEILAQEGDITVVELRAAPGGGGNARGAALSVELIHSPPTALHFSQVDLYAGLGVTGRLKLAGDGATTTVHGRLTRRLPFFAWRRKARLRKFLAQGLEALAARAAQLASATEEAAIDAAGDPGETERRKILEVTRRPDGSTRVWYRGEVLR